MGNQPRIKISFSKTDIMLEIFGLVALIILWGIAIFFFSRLPESVPVHFNVSGNPDGLGGKGSVFIGPIIATLLYLGLSLLVKYPHIFNYPVTITPENALEKYTLATRLIRTLKFGILCIFTLVLINVILTSDGRSKGFGGWMFLLILALTLMPTGYYIYKMVRK